MLQKFTVCRDDSIYAAWPDLVLTAGGKLICTFTACAHHGDRTNSQVNLCTSTDRGRTWTVRQPFSEMSQKEFFFNNSRIRRLADDSLVIICDRVDASVAKEHGPGTVIYLWRGDAEGEHWSEPEILPLCGIVPDFCELRDGRWLIAAQNRDKALGKLVQYVWYSDDRGQTWSPRITAAADPRYHLCEASLLEMPGGELVCFMRENSGDGVDCLKAISFDRGESWQGVYRVPIPACHRPVAGFLQDGRIMITHRYRHGGKGWLGDWTQNVFAAFTDVESALATERKQQRTRIMPLDYDRSPRADLGYTGWVQFADGEIYVVNYIVDDAPTAQIRGYSFYPSDVLLDE